MNNPKLFYCILIPVVGILGMSLTFCALKKGTCPARESISTYDIVGLNSSLDIDFDVRGFDPWSPFGWDSDDFRRWEEWFFYFQYMGNLSTSSYAETFFEVMGIDLSPFNDTEGVWVAYNCVNPPTSITGRVYPTFTSGIPYNWFHMTIRAYLHGSAEIWINNVKWFPQRDGVRDTPGWTVYETDITLFTVTVFELRVPNPTDFILLDRIYLAGRNRTH